MSHQLLANRRRASLLHSASAWRSAPCSTATTIIIRDGGTVVACITAAAFGYPILTSTVLCMAHTITARLYTIVRRTTRTPTTDRIRVTPTIIRTTTTTV